MIKITILSVLTSVSVSVPLFAQTTPQPTPAAAFADEVTVNGRSDSGLGSTASASEGVIGHADLEARPLLRSADIMEAVPGIVMTQHSTGGHAPIILLRGYNLDHGTDFATFVEGVPINLPSHAHAQGYSDLNFLITELIDRIDFQKGPYAAHVGDFGTAGSANVALPSTVAHPFASVEVGPHHFYRGVGAGGTSRWLYAGELSHYDGPSVVPDNFNRAKGVLRYTDSDSDNDRGAVENRSFAIFSYGARWTASDGYPARALARGYISRFGTLDPSDGGSTQRHLAVGSWNRASDTTFTQVRAYAQYYDFDLFSNLTFNTRDPLLGDQIEQAERRFSSGVTASQKRVYAWGGGRAIDVTGGVDLRNDLSRDRLFDTHERARTRGVFDNDINETSLSPYLEARVRWTPWLSTMTAVRGELFHVQVDSDHPENSGHRNAGLVSPKVGVVFGPFAMTELYVNGGYGFHSNHANGMVQRIDPSTPLVRTRGGEIGIRSLIVPNLQSSMSLWIIDSDSELVYVPEAGFTEPNRPGRRFGVEWNNFYRPRRWLAFDMDAAWSSARYRIDPNHEGRYIPDAIRGTLSTGVTVSGVGRFSGSVRGRYLGPRWLVSDGSVSSSPSFLLNAILNVQLTEHVSVGVEALNILNRHYDDIAYYFATRLRDPRPGGALEAAAQPDFVTHPGEPRTARVRWQLRF
jgi:hypothetical protein